MSKIILPELGEGIEKAIVAFWHFNQGDKVNKGEDVVELVTDKATFNISAEQKGTLKSILVQEGAEAKVGDTLAIIE